ncbi:MAG: LysR family transcriptional regulator [Sulfuriflexus sp.]|nr:LysR family transcriptional regulator [Sulfuriflexus sp.]
MHVTLRQLRVFEAVGRLKNYTRAAEELHLSQPAVSMQIKQLESNVGIALFDQVGKKISLTAAGHEMYQTSRIIENQLNETEQVLEDMKGFRHGRLIIAVASTANYFAPKLYAAFKSKYSAVTLNLDVTNREGLLAHLESNDSDMVIMGLPPKGIEVEAQAFMDNPLVVIASPSHPLATRKNISMERLQEETFIMREPGSGTRIAMERFFAEQGADLATGMEMSSNEAIKQAVQAGLGLGIVSLHTLEMELETKRLEVLDVEAFPILRHWYIVHRKGKRLSPLAKAFQQFILDNAANLLEMKSA